jgi:hypothetical protein
MYENKSFGYEINLDTLKIFLLLVSLLTSRQPLPGAGHAYYLLWILLATCSRLFQNITLNMMGL